MDDKTFQQDFDFYSKTLRGIQEPKPRWKRVVENTDGSLGELIGQVYVKEYLPKGTKEKLLEIGEAIKSVFAERIKNLDWMSAATKEKALKKLDAVIMKVGYPDKWKDLSSLQVCRDSYVKNVMNANKWGFQYMAAKYGKPVDRMEMGHATTDLQRLLQPFKQRNRDTGLQHYGARLRRQDGRRCYFVRHHRGFHLWS